MASENKKADTLATEFDTLFERMQSAEAKRATAMLFSATPEELSRAAVEQAARQIPPAPL